MSDAHAALYDRAQFFNVECRMTWRDVFGDEQTMTFYLLGAKSKNNWPAGSAREGDMAVAMGDYDHG